MDEKIIMRHSSPFWVTRAACLVDRVKDLSNRTSQLYCFHVSPVFGQSSQSKEEFWKDRVAMHHITQTDNITRRLPLLVLCIVFTLPHLCSLASSKLATLPEIMVATSYIGDPLWLHKEVILFERYADVFLVVNWSHRTSNTAISIMYKFMHLEDWVVRMRVYGKVEPSEFMDFSLFTRNSQV